MAAIGMRDEMDAYVGARIGLRRSALGLSQAALAQRLGISFQQVQKYETGMNRISASRLHRVASILGTSVGAFFPSSDSVQDADRDGGDQMLKALISTADGRLMAAGFPLIEAPEVRRALARLVSALTPDQGVRA
jgi:transcriptional regulator with XRE-family HTH domain